MLQYGVGAGHCADQAPIDDLFGSPVTRASPVSLTEIPSSLSMDNQFLVLAQSAPLVVCALEISPPNGSATIIERTTFADAGGDLFWLVTIPAGNDSGLVTVEVSCGGDPESRAAILG